MKKSRIIALVMAIVMIMSVVPAMANARTSAGGYFVDAEGGVYEKSGENLISNPGFEEGLSGLTDNEEYYEVSSAQVHSGAKSLKAIKSTKGDGAITAFFPVEDADASYYLSFWYKNTDEISRRPRVTFAFTDSSKTVPTVEDEFTDATHAWIGAGTASNDQDMAYSKGNWVQYTTTLKGNGNQDACKFVVLNIYGLTKNVSYVDDFELYELLPSDEYTEAFENAIEAWEKVEMPKGNLSGFGKMDLPMTTSDSKIGVKWISSSEAINAETGEYSSQADEELVILTARLYALDNEDIYYEFEYPYIVSSMFDPYIEWLQNEVFVGIGSSVKGDITLPKTHSIEGYQPATITWSCTSNNEADNAISPDGKFTAPEETHTVNLIATIECDGATADVAKSVKVLGGNIVADGLVMYYDFEQELDGSTLLDSSKNAVSYNATVEGVEIVDGFASFEGGESAIILPDNYGVELTGAYTVSMWVKLDRTIANASGLYRFFDFGGDTFHSQFIRFQPSTGEFGFMDRSTASSKEDFPLKKNVEIFGTNWKHITLVYDYNGEVARATAYINGLRVADSGSSTALTLPVSSIATAERGFIGRTQWHGTSEANSNPDFVGLMDDVRIYKRAISESEIQKIYTETRPTVTAPVKITFEDLDGNKIKDDVIVSSDVNEEYNVPGSYKSIPSYDDGVDRYIYKYVKSRSMDSITVDENSENVCKLVFQLEVQKMGENLIENPSFEEGVEGWTSNSAGTFAPVTGWVRSDEQAHEGNYSLKRNSNAGGDSAENLGTYFPIESGKKYRLTYWEYSSVVVGAGNSMMSAACVAKDKIGLKGQAANHLIEKYGGFSSWYNEGKGARDNSYVEGWQKREYEFDTTGQADANYILIAYAWSTAGDFYIDDFVLEEVVSGGDEVVEGGTEIIIKYEDVDGNTICPDKVITISDDKIQNSEELGDYYQVEGEYKTLPDEQIGGFTYRYTYNEKKTEGRDIVSISILEDNVATLVYDIIKAKQNLVPDGSFEDADGNFSWGTWQTPSSTNGHNNEYFKDWCEDWFYRVNRENNAAALYTAGLTAKDYALGTRWNDGVEGLCSMANFIPVKKGKTYLVSYDYKHKTAGANANYISTTFQREKNFAAGATGGNVPKNVSTDWQTNTFTITAPADGYIYFHFSWVGSGGPNGGNDGSGPYWYFDNFSVNEIVTFENNMKYVDGYAEIYAEDGTEGYLIQASYDEEGALESIVVSDKLVLSQESATRVLVKSKGAKLMLVKSLETLEPITPAIIAE